MKRMFFYSVAAWTIIVMTWGAQRAEAATITNYVWKDSTNESSPYTSWDTAAHTITAAVSAATAGNVVLVTNGTYTLTAQIYVNKAITVRSVNGKEYTFVDGGLPTYSNRCFSLGSAASGAIVDGFTITNGFGGVSMKVGTVRNCTIKGNRITTTGGGVYAEPGAVVDNCLITGNTATGGGGGGYLQANSGIPPQMWNSVISNNTIGGSAYGGGVYLYNASNPDPGGILSNCTVVAHTQASGYGAGIAFYGSNNKVINCEVRGNYAYDGGGVYVNGQQCLLRNCLICENSAGATSEQGGGGGLFFRVTLGGMVENCTIVSNKVGTGKHKGGGISSDGASTATITNTIVYSNLCLADSAQNNWGTNMNKAATWSYSCTTPTNGLSGTGNITNDPRFVNFASKNFRLSPDSPCINAGTNSLGWMLSGIDLDGKRRIVNAIVDIGAYEFMPQGTVFSLR